jgi:large subunit ribosomal protein L10
MDRAQKKEEIEILQKTFSENDIILLSRNKGMTVAQVTELRKSMRSNGARYKVTKNTLAKIALKGTQFESISDILTGPIGIISGKDPVATAKALNDFAKKSEEKLEIVGGFFAATKLDAKSVEKLAKMPSLNELRAKILGLLLAPATKVAGVLQAPAGQLARVIQAKAQKETA